MNHELLCVSGASCERVCVCECVSLQRAVVFCLASTHTAPVPSPSRWLFFAFLSTH